MIQTKTSFKFFLPPPPPKKNTQASTTIHTYAVLRRVTKHRSRSSPTATNLLRRVPHHDSSTPDDERKTTPDGRKKTSADFRRDATPNQRLHGTMAPRASGKRETDLIFSLSFHWTFLSSFLLHLLHYHRYQHNHRPIPHHHHHLRWPKAFARLSYDPWTVCDWRVREANEGINLKL